MQVYDLDEVLNLIERKELFSCRLAGSGCYIKIEEYLPVVCTAIHAGHELRPDLLKSCQLSDEERHLQESGYTDELISSQPVTLVCMDSRLEYDLNRPRALSTSYRLASKRKLWDKAHSAKQRALSHRKHQDFFTVYQALIAKLEGLFGMVIVFDIKAYNTQEYLQAPLFNIDATQIEMPRWQAVINKFHKELDLISIPNMASNTAIDLIDSGMNYLTTHTNAKFDRTLVLPTQIRKVYVDVETGNLYPQVLDALKLGLKQALSTTSALFQRKYNQRSKVRSANMLSSTIEPAVLNVDAQLYQLASRVGILKYVNPINLTAERRRFERAPERFVPDFHYRQLPLDTNEFKQKLYRIPIEQISDPAMKRLYSDMVNSLSEQLDLLSSVGQEAFLYHSLRHYGRPDATDIDNARFILYARKLEHDGGEIMDASAACELMKQQAVDWGMQCKVQLSSTLLARAMVSSAPPKLMVNSHARFSHAEVQRLSHHELGIHMATTLNSRQQPLKALRLGLPGATQTQEGLAILAELDAGYMAHERLNTLAYRVLAVDSMLKEQKFCHTYSFLVDEMKMDAADAFVTTTRVYRGGGFTKDHLYLSGFIRIKAISETRNLSNLLVGKTSYQYLDLIDELVERNWLTPPKFNIGEDKHQQKMSNNSNLDYLLDSLRNCPPV
ncbi:flavohemoglobin expression-modulating QEGLA motif protein [uncultured Shewanella sp.]|uniref:flavohemoglobin expression-modulating QEGLA motif protein n=1 Tax=uncultured Shewanella sp. TaxID=173975 RepID=UPI002630A46C|nr:flavohemoglobin expression-modulating QEGLA motif protein [uncultured Shewanella sp.]